MTSGHKKQLNRKAEGQDKRNQIEMKEKETTGTGNISNSYDTRNGVFWYCKK